MTIKKNKCVFFDRDNTLIYDNGYTFKKEDLKWKPGAVRVIQFLNQINYLVIIITNQSGVARGYYTEKDVQLFHSHMNEQLDKKHAIINDFYYCPFHPNGIGKYKKNSIDRKPNNGLILKAIKKWNISIKESFFCGNDKRDEIASIKSGLKYIDANKDYNLFLLVKKSLN
jgi:D,D-heptose 1,7-bisphosphate phosphatase